MSDYQRVLPRDLFNEANLLKCYGRLWILLSEKQVNGTGKFEEEEVPFFDIDQDPASGGLTIRNLTFTIGEVRHYLHRPLNARGSWPLYVSRGDDDPDFEEIAVFDDEGNFSDEMLELLGERTEA